MTMPYPTSPNDPGQPPPAPMHSPGPQRIHEPIPAEPIHPDIPEEPPGPGTPGDPMQEPEPMQQREAPNSRDKVEAFAFEGRFRGA